VADSEYGGHLVASKHLLNRHAKEITRTKTQKAVAAPKRRCNQELIVEE
jgi:hypothetical protein